MTRIQVRRGTSAFWVSENPILFPGEPGLETDTRKIKYGDGTTPWIDLPYSTSSGEGGTGGGGTGGGTADEDIPDLTLFYNNGKV